MTAAGSEPTGPDPAGPDPGVSAPGDSGPDGVGRPTPTRIARIAQDVVRQTLADNASAGLQLAVAEVVGINDQYAGMVLLTSALRSGRIGADRTARLHQAMGARRRAELAGWARGIADVLAAAGIDLDDRGTTVDGLRRYADLLDPREHVVGVRVDEQLRACAATCSCGWPKVLGYTDPGELPAVLVRAGLWGRRHEREPDLDHQDEPQDEPDTGDAGGDVTA
ncbi:hypothetical protein [Saccharothrix sp. HUAS TT1]|uniref:hypothetical protein n=1 Tax=unclassified Saccharothrix TaxID=2593673 RepID=UPI00345BE1C5